MYMYTANQKKPHVVSTFHCLKDILIKAYGRNLKDIYVNAHILICF